MQSRPLSILGAAAVAVALMQLATSVATADSYSFSNAAPIRPPDGVPAGTSASVTVTGTSGPVSDVNVQLRGVTSGRPTEFDIAITGPNGQTVVLMSDACGDSSHPVSDLTFNFDDEAGFGLPPVDCLSGSFRPTDYSGTGADPFTVPPTGTTLSVFDGAGANGVWTLRAYDVGPSGIPGEITRGLVLDIQTRDVVSPDTTLTKKPKDSIRAKAKLKFSASEAGSHFECKVDKRPFKACTSPLKLKNLKVGKHKVQVRAVDAAGNVDATPAKVKWKVLAPEKP